MYSFFVTFLLVSLSLKMTSFDPLTSASVEVAFHNHVAPEELKDLTRRELVSTLKAKLGHPLGDHVASKSYLASLNPR